MILCDSQRFGPIESSTIDKLFELFPLNMIWIYIAEPRSELYSVHFSALQLTKTPKHWLSKS